MQEPAERAQREAAFYRADLRFSTRKSRRRRLPAGASTIALGLFIFSAQGCAGPKTPHDIVEAEELERGGANAEEALAAWRRIGANRCALSPATVAASDPKDDCGLAGLREGELLERLARPREALAAWERTAAVAKNSAHAARALADAAHLAAVTLDDPATARALAWRCVETHPDDLAADSCLATAVRLERTSSTSSTSATGSTSPTSAATSIENARALQQRLDALAARFETRDLVDNLRFAAADLSEHELGDVPDAVARYDALAARFRRSSLRDDALYRAAHLLRDRKEYAGAVLRLERLLKTRRRAIITGSYNSEFLDDAQLLLGRIQLDDLHQPARAAATFAFLVDDFTDSTLRDDALLELSRARLAEGSRPAACAALARLLRQFPDGNQVRAATARSAELCDRMSPSSPAGSSNPSSPSISSGPLGTPMQAAPAPHSDGKE